MTKPLKILAFLLLFSCLVPAMATKLFEQGEWYFESFDELETLSVDVITHIIQDKKGFVWLASQQGLIRYDGYTFQQFLPKKNDRNSISGVYIQVVEEVNGKLWVGTYSDGLSIYDPETLQFTHFRHDQEDPLSLAENDVRVILQIDDYVFVGTHNGINLFTSDGRSLGIIQVSGCQGLLDKRRVNTLLYAAEHLWIGSFSGLCQVDIPERIDAGHTWLGEAIPEFDGQRVFHLMSDNLRQIWVGTINSGAAVLQPGNKTITRIVDSTRAAGERGITWIDEILQVEDAVWLATAGDGIAIVDPRSLEVIQYLQHHPGIPNSLVLDDVSALMQDRAGLIWIGTWGGGLNRFNPANRAFRTLRQNLLKTNSLTHADIHAIKELQNGEIWIGSSTNGIDVLRPEHGVIRGFRADETDPLALKGSYIFTIEQMVDGEVWVGALDHGLFRYLPEKDGFQQFIDLPSLADNTIRTLMPDDDHWLWIGTDAGLSGMDTETHEMTLFETGSTPSQPFEKVVETINIYQGYVWIGTNQGLFVAHRDGNKVVPVVSPEGTGLADNFISDIHIDKQGKMYLSTSLGLDRLVSWSDAGFDTGQVEARFESISAKIGRPGEGLGTAILEDDDGRLWINNRIVDTKTWELVTVHKSDGWDIGNMWIGSDEKLQDGTLLFGGTRGAILVRPELYRKWQYEPEVVVTQVARDNIQVPLAENEVLQLAPTIESFYVDFAALDYSASDQVMYQYQLVGYDSSWIHTNAKNRRATYSRLPPGDYQLNVRGTNKEGQWSSHELSIDVRQQPGWFETWWFRAVMLLVTGLILFVVYRLRVASLHRQKRELDALIRSRTADIELLGQIGQDITASLELESVLNSVYKHVHKLITCNVFFIATFDEKQQVIETLFLTENEKRRDNIQYHLSDSNRPAVWCVSQNKTLLTRNRLELLDYIDTIQAPCYGAEMESILYLPLAINDTVTGCISLQSLAQNAFSDNHIQMLKKVASYAAIALENAESHARLETALDEIERISLTDQLTGARNRRFLENLMPVEIARVKRARQNNEAVGLGFVLIDVDHFKAVNDTHGHDAGDQLLIQLVQLLNDLCRESDWVVRLGGEEFVVVAQIEEEAQLTHLAERILRGVEAYQFRLSDTLTLNKTCSIGLVTIPFIHSDDKQVNWQNCLNIADRALYAAKRNGRNAWVAIFAEQSDLVPDIYNGIINEPDKLRQAKKIHCPSSLPQDKSWQFM